MLCRIVKYYWYHVRNPFWLRNFGFWQSFRSFFCVKPSSWLNFIWNKTTSSKNIIIINSIVHDDIKTQRLVRPCFRRQCWMVWVSLESQSYSVSMATSINPRLETYVSASEYQIIFRTLHQCQFATSKNVICISFILNLLAKYINFIQIIEYSKHCLHMIPISRINNRTKIT